MMLHSTGGVQAEYSVKQGELRTSAVALLTTQSTLSPSPTCVATAAIVQFHAVLRTHAHAQSSPELACATTNSTGVSWPCKQPATASCHAAERHPALPERPCMRLRCRGMFCGGTERAHNRAEVQQELTGRI